MSKRTIALLSVLMLTLVPTLAFAAESNAVNPPGWVGGLMFFLALALPVAAGIWVTRR